MTCITRVRGFWPAAIATAAFFGYSHLGNQGETWVGALNAGLAGLLFCLLLPRSGDLWMAIGFHTAWNWGQSFFCGVPDSGASVPGNLFEPTFLGPAWLTGGSVGPKGSGTCTLVLGVISAAFGALREARYPEEPARTSMA